MLLPRFEMSEAEVVRRSHAVQWLAQLTTTPRWLPVIRTGYLILEIEKFSLESQIIAYLNLPPYPSNK